MQSGNLDKRVLLFGASGFVGRAVRLLLEEEGSELWLAHRRVETSPRALAVDISDRSSVVAAVKQSQPHLIIQAAGLRSPDLFAMTEVNCLGTVNVLAAMKAHSPDATIVLVGSAAQFALSDGKPIAEGGAIGPTAPYGAAKAAEFLLARSIGDAEGLDVRVAVLFNLAGPSQPEELLPAAFVRQVAEIELGLREPRLAVGNIETERDYVDVRDAARAILTIAVQGFRRGVYNVASGLPTSGRVILESLAQLASRPFEIVSHPSRMRAGEIPRVIGDPTKLYTEHGWAPRIPLQQSLADALDEWRSRLSADPAGVPVR